MNLAMLSLPSLCFGFDCQSLEYYIAATFVFFAVSVSIAQLAFRAPYGKLSEKQEAKSSSWSVWGPPIPHVIAWTFMETPNLYVGAYHMYYGDKCSTHTHSGSWINRLLLCLFLLHYVNRSIVYPLRLKNPKPIPLVVSLMAFCFCLTNGWLQSLGVCSNATYTQHTPLMWARIFLGVCVFFLGLAINVQSDNHLISLREESDRKRAQQPKDKDTPPSKPNESRYVVPRGSWFDRLGVSCPNYFGETLEWTGFALATNTYAAWSFAVFTCCFLGGRAVQQHQWYRGHFKEAYPKDRNAFFPFI
eukprot:GDKI01031953.1.p1 GENE.GDKI01031953.1~~GDKI01031953.1.p1  ORF type:complete len:303 (+),score=95.20 GDKI01031953.1:107-1015(+)